MCDHDKALYKSTFTFTLPSQRTAMIVCIWVIYAMGVLPSLIAKTVAIIVNWTIQSIIREAASVKYVGKLKENHSGVLISLSQIIPDMHIS